MNLAERLEPFGVQAAISRAEADAATAQDQGQWGVALMGPATA